MMKKLSIVVSVFNEEQGIEMFSREINKVLSGISWDYELIYVNDGSTDLSWDKLEKIAKEDMHVKLVCFSRNFGHEAAMIAGIDYSTGDGVICMDSDLQHPVELIPTMIEKFEAGYEVITMKRTKNKNAGLVKNITSAVFYKLMNVLSETSFEENASDFFAVAGNAVTVLKTEYREKIRFLRGYVQSIGFRKCSIEYEAKDRQAGESKYNIRKLMKFSVNALLNFSNKPLKFAGICSGFAALLGIVIMIYTIYTKFAYGTPNGYATIIVVLCFMFMMLFALIGVIGEYIGILFLEIKDRPIYIVRETKNLEDKN